MRATPEIIELQQYDTRYIEPIKRLLSQLTSSPIRFDESTLRNIIESDASRLFLLKDEDCVCGMITLAEYIAPTGRKMWIEDVVVDSDKRGKHFGKMLIEHVKKEAALTGGTLMLTSKPSRIAANALYRSAGFEYKETNVYKLMLATPEK